MQMDPNRVSYSSKVVVLKVKFVHTNNKKLFREMFAILCLRAEMLKIEREKQNKKKKTRSNRPSSFFLSGYDTEVVHINKLHGFLISIATFK